MSDIIVNYIYFSQAWIAIGLVMIILEIFEGSRIFFLPWGMSALLIGIGLYLIESGILFAWLLPNQWYVIVAFWSLMSIAMTVLLNSLRRRAEKNTVDINDY